MSKSLLEKSRAINKILQKIAGHPVNFFEIADVLCRNLECTVFIVGRRGQIGGYAFAEGAICQEIQQLIKHAERFPESFNQELLNIFETQTNIILKDGRKCLFNPDNVNCIIGLCFPKFAFLKQFKTRFPPGEVFAGQAKTGFIL